MSMIGQMTPEQGAGALAEKVGAWKGVTMTKFRKAGGQVWLHPAAPAATSYRVCFGNGDTVLASWTMSCAAIEKLLDGSLSPTAALGKWTRKKFASAAQKALKRMAGTTTTGTTTPVEMKVDAVDWAATTEYTKAAAESVAQAMDAKILGITKEIEEELTGCWTPGPGGSSLPLDPAQVAASLTDKVDSAKETDMMGTLSTSDMLGLAPVVLATATGGLYQPVRGTSPSSRYFLVAWHPILKLGCRYKTGSLSVRAEGTLLHSDTGLQSMYHFGFDKVSEGYCSFHVPVGEDNHILARKLLGSVLYGLGLVWETPMPHLDVIYNMGK